MTSILRVLLVLSILVLKVLPLDQDIVLRIGDNSVRIEKDGSSGKKSNADSDDNNRYI